MPKSKRNKVGEHQICLTASALSRTNLDVLVSLTKVTKKTKEHKSALITEVRLSVQWHEYSSSEMCTTRFKKMQTNGNTVGYLKWGI